MRAISLKDTALVCAAGALAGLGQAPWSLWPLSLFGFVVLMHNYRLSAVVRQAAWVGWIGGLGYFSVALFWIVEPFLVNVARHGWMIPFALFFLAGGLALLWSAAFAVGKYIRGDLWALVVLWTGSEMLREVLFTGFPWAMVGHIWIGHPMMQLAALGGAPLLSLLTLLLAAFLCRFWNALRGPGKAAPLFLGAALGLLVAGWGYGAYIVAQTPVALSGKIIRVVQPNAAQHLKWKRDWAPIFLERAKEMSAAPAPRPLDLILWPETSVPYRLETAPDELARIAQAGQGVSMIVGGNEVIEGRYKNALVRLGTNGAILESYHKHHLVPFGEYVPFGDMLSDMGLRGLAARDGMGFAPGPGPKLIELPGIGRAVPLICYELIFARNLRGMARADVIVQITNDAWFGAISGPYQHLAQARLRAVETGLPLVRAANTGVSAMIDPLGMITARTDLNKTAFIDAELPRPLPATLYARAGDWPMGAAMAGLLIWLLLRAVLQRRRLGVDLGSASR